MMAVADLDERALAIECELTRRFEAETCGAMTHSRYLQVLAAVTIRFVAQRLAAAENRS